MKEVLGTSKKLGQPWKGKRMCKAEGEVLTVDRELYLNVALNSKERLSAQMMPNTQDQFTLLGQGVRSPRRR